MNISVLPANRARQFTQEARQSAKKISDEEISRCVHRIEGLIGTAATRGDRYVRLDLGEGSFRMEALAEAVVSVFHKHGYATGVKMAPVLSDSSSVLRYTIWVKW